MTDAGGEKQRPSVRQVYYGDWVRSGFASEIPCVELRQGVFIN